MQFSTKHLFDDVYMSFIYLIFLIGRGHLPGILKNWDRLPERVKELQMTADDLIDRNNVNRVAAFGPPSPLQ